MPAVTQNVPRVLRVIATTLQPPCERLTQVTRAKGALFNWLTQNFSFSSGYVTPSFLYSEVTSQFPSPLVAAHVTSVSSGIKSYFDSVGMLFVSVMSSWNETYR